MDYEALLNEILNIGSYLIQSGGETFRAEDSMYYMARAYDIKHCDFFAIQSNIQGTILTKEGIHHTQIRRISGISCDFDRLDKLNNLSRRISRERPAPKEIHAMFEEVMHTKKPSRYMTYLAAMTGELGFGILFNCNLPDCLVVMVMTVLVMNEFGDWLLRREHNTFVYNLILCCVSSSIVAVLARLGFPIHVDRVVLTLIFLLIGGLGITNGIRDLINRDLISGMLNMANSIVGAVGIACGIFLGLSIWHDSLSMTTSLVSDPVIQVLSCGIGCFGFGLYYNTSMKQCISCSIGAMLTFAGYLLGTYMGCDAFTATILGAFVTALFSFIMARIHRAPATIFLTTAIFPLLPGTHLFYSMYAVVQKDYSLVRSETFLLLSLCLAIQFGYIIADILTKYAVHFYSRQKKADVIQ